MVSQGVPHSILQIRISLLNAYHPPLCGFQLLDHTVLEIVGSFQRRINVQLKTGRWRVVGVQE